LDQDFFDFQDYLESEEYEEGIFAKFDQSEFVTSAEASTLADHGWLYYPKTCTDGGCKLVVVMHGGYERARAMALPTAGWIQVAHLNNFIVLLPQLAGGAWEDAAELDDAAGTNTGEVETAIMAMAARVMEDLDAERDYEAGNYF